MKNKSYCLDIVLYLGPFILELLCLILNNLIIQIIVKYILWSFYIIVILGIWHDLYFDGKRVVLKKIICTLVLVLMFYVFGLLMYFIIVGIWQDKKLEYKYFPLRMIVTFICLVVFILPDWDSFVRLFDYNFWRTASSLEVFEFWFGVAKIGIVFLVTVAVHFERTMSLKRSNVIAKNKNDSAKQDNRKL